MCDLMTGVLVASGLSMGGQMLSGFQQNRVASANASAMRREAAVEQRLGQLRESATRRDFRQKAGLQRNQLAASGVTLDSLTSLDLGADLGQQGFLAAQNDRIDSSARQRRLTTEASLARAEGRMAAFRGVTGAAGTALNAAPTLWPSLSES